MTRPPGRLDHLTPEEKRALLERLLQKKATSGAGGHDLSHGQLALWFLHRLAPDSPSYNVPLAWWVRSEVDPDALRQAFQGLAERHAVLRTAFVEAEGQPRRHVQHDHEVSFELIEASHLSAAELEERVEELAHRPFDLGDGHPLRVYLLRRVAGDPVLVMVFHHIAYDLWSGMRVLGDLRDLYRAALAGIPPDLGAAEKSYGDFVRWQASMLASEEGAEHWTYWRDRLRRGGSVPVLELPTDLPRPPVQTHQGATVRRRLPGELLDRLRAVARGEGVTVFTVLLSAYQILLHRYSGQHDLIVGSPMTGRSRQDFDDVVGYFVNTLPLRADITDDLPYRGFLEQVRETVRGALEHQDFPADLIADRLRLTRDPSQTPLFQTMFVHNRAHGLSGRSISVSILEDSTDLRVEMPSLVLETFALTQRTAIVDLALTVHESDAALTTTWQFNTDLFREDTVRRMATHFEALLDDLSRRPDATVGSLTLLTERERETLVHEWNDFTRIERADETLPLLFRRQAGHAPERLAISFESTSLTYGELDDRSDRLAAHLRERGIGRGQLVGIFTSRGLDMVVGLLGVLKAGAAYVPMDPSYPPDRLAFMLSDSDASLVLSERSLADAVPTDGPPTVCLDELDWSALPHPGAPLEPPASGDRAYVIYTSGSTGKPKGVEIPHGALVNFLLSMQREPGFTADDVLLAVTTLSFDIAGLELWLPLIAGGRTVLLSREETWDAEALARALENSGATTMQATPATWRLLIDGGWRGSTRLKALCGGESLPQVLARELFRCTRELWNMYGPTETTIWSTVDRVDSAEWQVSIGSPIANTQIYILDERLRLVPIGVPGELCIGGAGVALGYLNRPELTADRFVPDPFLGTPGARLYRTGDRARVLADGRIEYLGRLDFQVKLRGFRIELGEIEAALGARPGLAQAVVAVHEHSAGDKRLVAYIVGEGGGAADPTELRRALAEALPDYMIPSAYVFLDAFPLTPNGKVDRGALPAPESTARGTTAAYVEPTGDLEPQIATAWRDVLKVDRVGRHDNFFDLGGNSLLILQVHSRVKRLIERDLPVVKMFEHPTVAALAAFMGGPASYPDTLQKAQERAAARKKEREARPGTAAGTVTPDAEIESPLRIGVLGTARVVPQALLHPAGRVLGVAVEAIAARSRDRALAFARTHTIPRALGSYAELLGDDRIDAVYVALPTALHAEWVQRALESGKHVLCEKPLAATAARARDLAAAARKRGRVLQEAMQVVYHPGLRRVRELVGEGRAGPTLHVESCFRIPRVPMAPGDFRLNYELGGGAALDLGCYAVACLRHVIGGEPEVIRARARLVAPRVDRWMRAECVLESGLTARLECGFRGWYRRRLGVKVSCERGWIEWTPDGLAYQTEGKVVREDVGGPSPYEAQLTEFIERCRRGPSAGRTLEDSVATLVVIDAMYEHAGLAPRPSAAPVPT